MSEHDVFHRFVTKIDPEGMLLRAWPLKGGMSAQVTAMEIAGLDGNTRKVVVRQHAPRDLKFKFNPHIAADEFRLLQCLQTAGLPAPAPIYLDVSGEIVPTPVVVMEFVDGQPEFAPADLDDFIRQVATTLAQIHGVDSAALELSFLPRQSETVARVLGNPPANLDASLDEGLIRAALEAVWPLPRPNPSVLLHGDFWPGNFLWQNGKLAAVIDWEDAATGDPLADLAITRLDLLWAFGIEAMQRFTTIYQSLTTVDFTNLPYWDLYTALRPAGQIAAWAGVTAREEVMRAGHALFVAQAFETIKNRR